MSYVFSGTHESHTVVLNVNPSIMDRHDKGRNVKQLILRHLVSNTVNQS